MMKPAPTSGHGDMLLDDDLVTAMARQNILYDRDQVGGYF
jgi:hypothetical protein